MKRRRKKGRRGKKKGGKTKSFIFIAARFQI